MSATCARQLPRAILRTRHPLQSPSRHAFARSPAYSYTRTASRPFSSSHAHRKESFRSRLNSALKNTKVKWEPIPIALGVAFLGAFQFYRVQRRENHNQSQPGKDTEDTGVDQYGRPQKRERIRPSGPWTVQIMSTLPLKAMSRLWGRFNELQIPYYLRVPGFKLYSFIFGVK